MHRSVRALTTMIMLAPGCSPELATGSGVGARTPADLDAGSQHGDVWRAGDQQGDSRHAGDHALAHAGDHAGESPGDGHERGDPLAGDSNAVGALPGLEITGDPKSTAGANWTYTAVEGTTVYNLAGVLLEPVDSPSSAAGFPAVILSHGTGGTARTIAVNHGLRMRGWGMVAISVNYTHAGAELTSGESPGVFRQEMGASSANVSRARKCIDVLASLGYVDMTRIAAHGHSRGAFVTGGLAGAHSSLLRAASHTAGGVDDARVGNGWISTAQAEAVSVPYQLHHGADDQVVPTVDGERFAGILAANAVAHEIWIYDGKGHNVASLPDVITRIQGWYQTHGVL